MKLQKKEMLSNFEIGGFWRELQMTMEKIVWSRLWRPPLAGGLQEASGGVPEASRERLGSGGGGPETAEAIFRKIL